MPRRLVKKPNPSPGPSYQRTDVEVVADLHDIGELMLERYGLMEIRKIMGERRRYTMSPVAIAAEMQKVLATWRERMEKNVNAVRERELAGIDKMERELWKAWYASIGEPLDETTTKETEERDGGTTRKGIRRKPYTLTTTRTVSRKKYMTGLSYYMDGIKWCIETRLKIYGLLEKESFNEGHADGEKRVYDTSVTIMGRDGQQTDVKTLLSFPRVNENDLPGEPVAA